MNHKLLKIIMGEGSVRDNKWEMQYEVIAEILWKEGFPGLTLYEAKAGLNEKDSLLQQVVANNTANNLPISIEAVHESAAVDAMIPRLQDHLDHGELVTFPAQIMNSKENAPMPSSKHLMLKIYIKEESHIFETPLYEKIMKTLSDYDLIWTTITEGIEGFGKDHQIYKKPVFSLSDHTPIIIESISDKETIEKILPELDELVKDGLIITMPVNLHLNR